MSEQDHTADIFKALGMLTESVDGLRRDFEKSEEKSRESRERTYRRLDEIGDRMVKVEGAAVSLKDDLGEIKGQVADDVLPTVAKVKVWEQRGIGFLAAAGIVGTGFGAMAAAYLQAHWDSIQKLLREF